MGDASLAGDGFDPRREASRKMTIIARLMRRRFDQAMATRGVTRAQWTLIIVAARMPGASQRDIADALEVTEAAAGRLIERLCEDGLLERRVDASDKRARRVFLTEKAKPLLEIFSQAGLGVEASTFAGLSEPDIVHFAALLDRIHANLAGNEKGRP